MQTQLTLFEESLLDPVDRKVARSEDANFSFVVLATGTYRLSVTRSTGCGV